MFFLRTCNKLFLSLFILISGFSLSSAQEKMDHIILKSGEIVAGNVTTLTDTAVTINSTLLGDITLKRKDIESITFNTVGFSTYNYGYTKKDPRPNYDIPKWYKSYGIAVGSFGLDLEVGRLLSTSDISGFFKSGIRFPARYDITTIPFELGTGFFIDSAKKDVVQFHGGYAVLLSSRNWNNTGYTPSWVYGADYRHIFPNRSHPQRGTYLELGYQGGVLQREFVNWWGQEVSRTVNRNRLKFTVGWLF